jgi:hypothetical protein
MPWAMHIGHAKFFSRSHDAVICVYDDAGNVIETPEHKGDFKKWSALQRETKSRPAVKGDGSMFRLVDRFRDYSGRFAVQVCSVQGATKLQPGHGVGPKAWPMRTLLFRYQIAV